MMKAKSTHQNKFLRIITMPIKALAKARDFYVRSMNNYADRAYYVPSSGWAGTTYTDSLPRSLTTTATRSRESEDFKELVRAASTSTLGNRVDLGSVLSNSSTRKPPSTSTSTNSTMRSSTLLSHNQQPKRPVAGFKGVPRSASVGMAMIEEDKPAEFEVINQHGAGNDRGATSVKHKFSFFSRSKSYASAATTKRNPFAPN